MTNPKPCLFCDESEQVYTYASNTCETWRMAVNKAIVDFRIRLYASQLRIYDPGSNKEALDERPS